MAEHFTQEQLNGLLKQGEAGRPVAKLCRQIGITDTTFYKWRSTFAGLEVSEVRQLRELAEENRRFGRPRLSLLLRRKGLVVSHKRGERLSPGLGRSPRPGVPRRNAGA